MKFGKRYLNHDTPRAVKHVVDSINAGIAFAGGAVAFAGYPRVALAVLASTVVLSAISNLCASDACEHDCTCPCAQACDLEKH